MYKKVLWIIAPALALAVTFAWNTDATASKKELGLRNLADRELTLSNPTISSTMAVCESTGYEAIEGPCGWELGWMCGSTFTACLGPPIPSSCTGNPLVDIDCCIGNPNPLNGWYVSGTTQHCNSPTVENANPSTGEQHLRIAADPTGGNPPGCTGFGTACRVNAFTPVGVAGVQSPGPLTLSMDVAMGLPFGTPPFGGSLQFFTVYDAGPGNQVWYFHYYGVLFVYDDAADGYVGLASLYGDGFYQTFRAEINPCLDTIDYYVDDVLVHATQVADGQPTISRAIFNNNNVGGWHDIDNYSVARHGECPAECGNDIVEGTEECDGTDDPNCPGRCDSNCVCTRPCSDCGAPCAVNNGANGPFLTDGGLYSYTADTPFTSIDTCGSDYDTVLFWNVFDNCGNFELVNDECTNTTFGGSQELGDPSASCYAPNTFPLDSCLCAATTPGQTYTFQVIEYLGTQPALGGSTVVNIRKKIACGEEVPGGACCRGLTGMCEDGVSAEECNGQYDTYTEGKLCSSPSVPACVAITGSCCNSAPGAGGACAENVTQAMCEFTWTPGGTCSTCTEVQGACCNALLGSCSQTLQGACNCADCTWTEGAACNQVSCNPIQGACCEQTQESASCTQTSQAGCNCEGCTDRKSVV